MTQEIKDKLEQAAAYHQGSGLDFMAGAQTILENPSEWGLVDSEIYNNVVKRNFEGTKKIKKLQSKLEFYKRRADHNPNSPFNRIANAVDKKLLQILDEQKKAGKKFISDEEIDQLIDEIVKKELGNDTRRS